MLENRTLIHKPEANEEIGLATVERNPFRPGTSGPETYEADKPFSRSKDELNDLLGKRERETALLLKVIYEIACAKSKNDLEVTIQTVLKKVIRFQDLLILIINPDNITQKVFIDGVSNCDANTEKIGLIQSKECHPIADGISDIVYSANVPLVWQVADILKWPSVPSYINYFVSNGIKKVAGIPLYNKQKAIGAIFISSDRENAFENPDLRQIQAIASHLSIGILNILANQENENREHERQVLMSFSASLAAVKDKRHLSIILDEYILSPFNLLCYKLDSLNDLKATHGTYLISDNAETEFGSDFFSLTELAFPIQDVFFQKFLRLKKATILDLKNITNQHDEPIYISVWKKSGIEHVTILPVFLNERISHILFLMPKKGQGFSYRQLDLLDNMASYLSTALENIQVCDELKHKEIEKEILLAISNDIAAIRNKKALLRVLHDKLKLLFPFNDLIITCLNDDKKLSNFYIYNFEQRHEVNSPFERIVSSSYPVKDGVIELVLESEDPLIFSIEELTEHDNCPEYIRYYHKSGIKELLGVPLRNGKEDIGTFWLTSDSINAYTPQHLASIKGVSSQLSIAVANILANEIIVEREREKATLLQLGNKIAMIRDKSRLLTFLQEKTRKIIPFDDILITVFEEDPRTQHVFLKFTNGKRSCDLEFEKYVFELAGGAVEIINQVINSEDPIFFNIERLKHNQYIPAFITTCEKFGIQDFVGISLRDEHRIIGTVYLFSKHQALYQQKNSSLIIGLAEQLSFAVNNILATEDLIRRENEKSTLVTISNDLASIRSKNELLRTLHNRMAKIFYFSHAAIALVNQAANSYAGYIFDPFSKSRVHPDYDRISMADHTLNHWMIDIVLSSDLPTVFSLEELVEAENVPSYVQLQHECGLKEIVFAALKSGNNLLGFLFILSDKINGFLPHQLDLIQGIAYQLTTAVANIIANEEISVKEHEKSTLLTIGKDIATIRNKADLHRIINDKLKKILPISHILTAVISDDGQWYSPYILDPESISKNHKSYDEVINSRIAVFDGITDSALLVDYPVVFRLSEIIDEPRIPSFLKMNYECGIREVVYSALTNGRRKTGMLVVFVNAQSNLNSNNLTLIQGVSAQLSTAIANILANEEIIERENEKSKLLSFSNNIASVRDKIGLSKVIGEGLNNFFNRKEYLLSTLNDDATIHSYFLYSLSPQIASSQGFQAIKDNRFLVKGGLAEVVLNSKGTVTFNINDIIESGNLSYPSGPIWQSMGVSEIVGIPLRVGNKDIGILWTYPDKINDRLLQAVSAQIGIALANTLANEKIEKQVLEISGFKQKLEVENLYLQEEIQTTHNYSEIIGASSEMEKVFQLVSQVAETQSSVLLLGETGTGKELIARAIHNTSPRKDKLMVKVNCAALPVNLIESELFGHEKGSFTGATDRRIGKFELANNGTLFLDEIGEMPLELQVKLLRAIQEKEIERVGGRSVIKTDVRIIAATNRNLQKEVQQGNFRSDLFFRLNVFPITIPPLRDRKEDIPTLASHFLEKHAKKGGKRVLGFSAKVINELTRYYWPGNVRELEHLIERSILLTSQPIISQLHLPVEEANQLDSILPGARVKTIDEVEREHILQVLNACNGKIAGPGGAADLLMIPPTTLNSKIKRLGIKKGY